MKCRFGSSFVVAALVLTSGAGTSTAAPLANLAHLERLCRPITLGGRPALTVAIYASAPGYEPEDAPGEGYACVDDTARAAVVFLEAERLRGDERYLELARKALIFVLWLQEPDGTFANFVDRSGVVNRDGVTSRPSLDFWASRGLWALGRGVAAFEHRDPVFANELHEAARRTVSALALDLQRHEKDLPVLPRGTDCWSEALLGLVALEGVRPERETRDLIEKVAGALSRNSSGGPSWPLFGGFHLDGGRPWTWHGWGSRQALALAKAGAVMEEGAWVAAARTQVEGLNAHLLTCGLLASMDPVPLVDPQIAYTVSPLVGAAAALYRSTGEEHFAVMAGLAGAWFFGDNPAATAMYDPVSGRCMDGIDQGRANRNAGAESTIEALLALLALEDLESARPFLHAKVLQRSSRHVVSAGAFFEGSGGFFLLSICLEQPLTRAVTLLLDGRPVARLAAGGLPGPRRVGGPIHVGPGSHVLAPVDPVPGLSYLLLVPLSEEAVWDLPDGGRVRLERDALHGGVRVLTP